MNRILVATDGSPAAVEASRFGIELAREHAAELVFAHVVPEFDVVPATVFQIGGVFPHDAVQHDIALLEDAAALAASAGIVATTALLRGETVDTLVAYAEAHGVDLLVVGSRGHGAFVGKLLGSVSLELRHRSRLPVAIVRAPVEQRQSVSERESVIARN